MNTVPAVVPYDAGWPAWFDRVRLEPEPLLAPWATTPIQHIGSRPFGSDLWRERQLLERSGGAPYDAADKRDFVRRVLAGTGMELRDDRHALGR